MQNERKYIIIGYNTLHNGNRYRVAGFTSNYTYMRSVRKTTGN